MTIGSDLRNGDSNIWTLLDCYEELCNEIHTFIFVPVHIQLFASVSSTLVFEVHFTSLQISYVTRILVRVSDTIRIGYADTHFPKKHTASIINNYI